MAFDRRQKMFLLGTKEQLISPLVTNARNRCLERKRPLVVEADIFLCTSTVYLCSGTHGIRQMGLAELTCLAID